MRFDGKSVLITGATRGIGAATARAFAELGANLLLTGRDEVCGAEVLASIADADGEAAFVAADLREPTTGDALVADAVARYGQLDVLVNNAGIIYRVTAEETTDEQWRDTMAVNVDAVMKFSRAAVRVMKHQAGGGAIVNVASDASFVGGQRSAAYCASKGAVIQLTRAMALDHAAQGIRVNSVCPTDVETPMLAGEARQLGTTPEAYFAEAAKAVPMGRIAQPEDVANAIVFLASDRASFITGTGLLVDGGATAQ
jgi:NAD(P)-dependent dehydrogenase (short-subunit alcohol dehydrogenase family)